MGTDGQVVDIRTTVDDHEVAHHIARTIVHERLAACAHVSSPVTSYYWWEDEMQTTLEYEITLRTVAERVDDVSARVLALHPYGLAALVRHDEVASPTYGNWVREGSSGAA